MHTRSAITGQLGRYALAVLISAGIHWRLFRSPWTLRPADSRTQIQLQQGIHAVELTLLPAIASQASQPQPTEPPPPAPEPEPIKEAPPEPQPAITLPEPEQKKLEGEAPAEPQPLTKNKEKTPAQTIDATEQTGSLQTKGVSAGAKSAIKPIYPRRSNLLGEEGTVTIQAHISRAGKVLDAVISKSSGFRRLDQSALKAVNQAEFTPAIKDGQPAEDVVTLNFKFELHK